MNRVFKLCRRWLVGGVALLATALLADLVVAAEARQLFQSAATTWRVADADCRFELMRHQRTFDEAHTGRGCEHLRLRTGQGTYLHLAHDVAPARIIAELSPQLWVKSDRPGVQLYARAVLPRSRDEHGQLLTALLPGESYQDVGMWRQLRVVEIHRELERQLRILRRQFGSQVDAKEAYIDLLVLNAYGGAGNIDIWIDDLELAGFASTGLPDPSDPVAAPAADAARPSIAASAPAPLDASPQPAAQALLDGSVLTVEGRPVFARVIEHQGESFSWLQQLGCNVIRLAASPTEGELAEAKRLGIWLLAPPPVSPAWSGTSPGDRVLAWTLGDGLTRNELAATRAVADQVRGAPVGLRRPLVCGALDGFGQYAEVADIVVLGRDTLGTSFPLSSYGDWLRDTTGALHTGAPFWAALESELSAQWEAQANSLSRGAAAATVAEPLQVQLLAAEAIAAGARGLYFRSRTRLDLPDPATKLRAAILRLINRQLLLIEPWAAGGAFAAELPSSVRDTRVRILETQRSRLLVICQHAADQQRVAGPWRTGPTSFLVQGTPLTDQAYLLGGARLEPLRGERAGGVRVALDATTAVSFAMLTQEPLVINHVRAKLAETADECLETRQQIAALLLDQTTDVDRQIAAGGHGLPQAADWLSRARATAEHATRLRQAGDRDNASRRCDELMWTLYQLRRAHWERAVRTFSSPSASPLVASYASLPWHWQLSAQLAGAGWESEALPGGDFEDLELMLRSGWSQSRTSQVGVETSVELSFLAPRSGRSALRLQAWTARGQSAPRLEDWPVTITSAPVPVVPGQLLRIHGWVKVTGEIRDSREGLIICDTLGGLALAERIYATKGWQEFTLYRVATGLPEERVTLALTGLGEVWLDDLSLTTRQ